VSIHDRGPATPDRLVTAAAGRPPAPNAPAPDAAAPAQRARPRASPDVLAPAGPAEGEPTRYPVLVVDDHELVGSTVVLALQDRGYEAHRCGTTSRADILATAAALPPGLVLLDLELGSDSAGRPLDGVDLIGDLNSDGWRVLVVTGVVAQDRLAAAVTAGAAGVLLKTSALRRFLELVEQAADGRLLMPPAERRQWVELHRRRRGEASRLAQLTTREREVLERLAAGARAGAIATADGVSITTVRTHIRAVLVKLGVSSQLEAAALLRNTRSAP
jgi:DNA-binding NarL/FixJ family response regulator